MGNVHEEVYRGYTITIDIDNDPQSPEEWQDGSVVFVSYHDKMLLPHTKEGKKQASDLRRPEDLLAFMAQDENDKTSKHRVFAVDLNVTSRGVYRRGCSFEGEVFASAFSKDEDDDDFDHDEWEQSLPRAAIVVERGHFDRPLTTEMLVRIMETGVVPDFDARGAERHFQFWLSWFDNDIFLYSTSTDAERLIELGVDPDEVRDYELSDACCGYYVLDSLYLKRQKAEYDAIDAGDYGGALAEARGGIDAHLDYLERSGPLPAALRKDT